MNIRELVTHWITQKSDRCEIRKMNDSHLRNAAKMLLSDKQVVKTLVALRLIDELIGRANNKRDAELNALLSECLSDPWGNS